ncbi:MAG: FHA domain-containing protein [Lachnospiraceae bacterium]|nr:FHA domain-containing protein [Lachnospiraceae bacterium]
MLTVILVITAILFSSLFMILEGKKAQKHRLRQDRAAALLLREQLLTRAIKGEDGGGRYFPVLFLSFEMDGSQEFAFPAEQGVRIGRDPGENEISIRHPYVSGRHCCVYMADGRICLADLGSGNGTFVRRGIRKTRIRQITDLRDGESFFVGNIRFRVRAKVYDAAYLT